MNPLYTVLLYYIKMMWFLWLVFFIGGCTNTTLACLPNGKAVLLSNGYKAVSHISYYVLRLKKWYDLNLNAKKLFPETRSYGMVGSAFDSSLLILFSNGAAIRGFTRIKASCELVGGDQEYGLAPNAK